MVDSNTYEISTINIPQIPSDNRRGGVFHNSF